MPIVAPEPPLQLTNTGLNKEIWWSRGKYKDIHQAEGPGKIFFSVGFHSMGHKPQTQKGSFALHITLGWGPAARDKKPTW